VGFFFLISLLIDYFNFADFISKGYKIDNPPYC
jgi:hypothetical protein